MSETPNSPTTDAGQEPKVYMVRLSVHAQIKIATITGDIISYYKDRVRGERWGEAFYQDIGSLATLPHRYEVFQTESRLLEKEVRCLLFSHPLCSWAIYHTLYEIVEESDDGALVRIICVRNATGRPMTRREAAEVLANQ